MTQTEAAAIEAVVMNPPKEMTRTEAVGMGLVLLRLRMVATTPPSRDSSMHVARASATHSVMRARTSRLARATAFSDDSRMHDVSNSTHFSKSLGAKQACVCRSSLHAACFSHGTRTWRFRRDFGAQQWLRFLPCVPTDVSHYTTGFSGPGSGDHVLLPRVREDRFCNKTQRHWTCVVPSCALLGLRRQV